MVLTFCRCCLIIFIFGNLLMGWGLEELNFLRLSGYGLATIKILGLYI